MSAFSLSLPGKYILRERLINDISHNFKFVLQCLSSSDLSACVFSDYRVIVQTNTSMSNVRIQRRKGKVSLTPKRTTTPTDWWLGLI
ncbi:MAG TPA: hypothetical protein VFN35_25235 [Ktedonobacteraceae bacterium]|nr:hypothetical protein [Ktedonobacteraceae bacterium]